jgi:transposase
MKIKGVYQMSQRRKNYSAEFKTKVALAAIREEGSLSELSSRFGVNANVISKWKKQVLVNLSDIFSGKHETRQLSNDQQVKELHAKIGELTVEKDFLQQVSMKFVSSGGKK